ncbi:PucR family transcriptional regulator [Streptomyces rhizosphaericus]|uniref:PucR family transcriptional regulator n=1 Tax=Streptomyces rhizosphaericus TaxID=114699 RepID=A0A6G4A9P2_9ACTN|nr:PucR family transcriptional regulator ligand-binding domain-containing protein [Streptomyces rhizosphaericus]MBI0378926.1 PucR family transcriptional regulator ligand-binding domain-containing protein [Streptomyces albiflaviniger]NEW70025.1 PucR family transcriptional regulator [Streptomyces rhizosphaericus]
MALSVAAALQLEVFSRTTVRVYAGEKNLHHTIRWVHPVEIPDIGQFLTGGELLLTAGLGVGRTASEQRRYIREVSAAGASALVIELSGRAFTTMPPALIDEAERLGFPLIGLTDELPFVEVSAQVHELIADERNSDLVAFERLNADFIQLLLASRNHVSFAEALAHNVGSPVVLEDTDHQVVAYAGGTAETDLLMRNWGLHARMAHQASTPGGQHNKSSMVQSHDEPGCTRRMIVLRGEAWGWIHVFHGDGELTGVHAYALDRAADTIAIALLGDRESGVRASHRQSSLINRLLLGDITGEQFVDRALRVGRDLRDRPLAVVVLCKEPDSDGVAEAVLEPALKSLKAPAVVADIGDHVLAVVGLTKQLSAQQLADELDTCGARAGVSRSGPARRLADAARQARTAASVAATREKPTALYFDRLGVLRLLVALAEGPELGRYVDDELGPLLRHDATDANPLLPTLRAYLAADGNKSRAAETLFIQRRTLYYRIERLNSLLGRSVDDPEVRGGLSLALRALDLVESDQQLQPPGPTRKT